ncbi:MAG: nuclear transport factor 2 family protein [Candidatus Binatia bacterium]|nr:nuclear transport factor 2 family protein [Candidatus Binatia bacterium]
MDAEELARRVQTLEDIEAIKKLKARYCAYCDDGYDADGIASLFTPDGVWDGGPFGKYEGQEAIRTFFRGASQIFPFALHYVTNPLIEVEGQHATGRWYLLQPATLAEGEQRKAVWLAARYEEEYVKVHGEWKFKRLTVSPAFLTPFDQGWVKKQFVRE